jgi:hypothetical protein
MNARRFDNLAQRMATTTDRRRFLAGLGGLTLGMVASPALSQPGGKPGGKPKDGKVKLDKPLKAKAKLHGGGKFEGEVLDPVVSVEDGTATLSGTLQGTVTTHGKKGQGQVQVQPVMLAMAQEATPISDIPEDPIVEEPIETLALVEEPIGDIVGEQTGGTCTLGYITLEGTLTVALLGLHLVITDLTILLEGDPSEGLLGTLLCSLAGTSI